MKYRKLRIAWSVGWGMLCVLHVRLSPADEATCTFGVRQVAQVLDDRPSMRGILEKDSAVYKWVVQQFDKGFFGDRIYWDKHEPHSGQPYENQPAFLTSPAFIRITRSEDISGRDKWFMLVFELHNIKNAKSFDNLDKSVISGKANRDDYANDCLSLEFKAMVKTQNTFRQNPIPGANEKSDPYYVGYMSWSDDIEAYKNVLDSDDADAYDPRVYFGNRFDWVQRNSKSPWSILFDDNSKAK